MGVGGAPVRGMGAGPPREADGFTQRPHITSVHPPIADSEFGFRLELLTCGLAAGRVRFWKGWDARGLAATTTIVVVLTAGCSAAAPGADSDRSQKPSSATPTTLAALVLGNGAVSWTYGTTTQTNPGTGTHTVTCTLGGI